MADHVKVIAILNFVWAALAFVGGLQFFIATGFGWGVDAPIWMQSVALAFMVLAIPAVIAGIGLVRRRLWGRTFAYVTAALSLVSIPIGTAYGIYTFVMMRRPEVIATLS